MMSENKVDRTFVIRNSIETREDDILEPENSDHTPVVLDASYNESHECHSFLCGRERWVLMHDFSVRSTDLCGGRYSGKRNKIGHADGKGSWEVSPDKRSSAFPLSYMGSWSRGLPDGFGQMVVSNKVTLSGRFERGRPTGFCSLMMPNEEFMSARFVNGAIKLPAVSGNGSSITIVNGCETFDKPGDEAAKSSSTTEPCARPMPKIDLAIERSEDDDESFAIKTITDEGTEKKFTVLRSTKSELSNRLFQVYTGLSESGYVGCMFEARPNNGFYFGNFKQFETEMLPDGVGMTYIHGESLYFGWHCDGQRDKYGILIPVSKSGLPEGSDKIGYPVGVVTSEDKVLHVEPRRWTFTRRSSDSISYDECLMECFVKDCENLTGFCAEIDMFVKAAIEECAKVRPETASSADGKQEIPVSTSSDAKHNQKYEDTQNEFGTRGVERTMMRFWRELRSYQEQPRHEIVIGRADGKRLKAFLCRKSEKEISSDKYVYLSIADANLKKRIGATLEECNEILKKTPHVVEIVDSCISPLRSLTPFEPYLLDRSIKDFKKNYSAKSIERKQEISPAIISTSPMSSVEVDEEDDYESVLRLAQIANSRKEAKKKHTPPLRGRHYKTMPTTVKNSRVAPVSQSGVGAQSVQNSTKTSPLRTSTPSSSTSQPTVSNIASILPNSRTILSSGNKHPTLRKSSLLTSVQDSSSAASVGNSYLDALTVARPQQAPVFASSASGRRWEVAHSPRRPDAPFVTREDDPRSPTMNATGMASSIPNEISLRNEDLPDADVPHAVFLEMKKSVSPVKAATVSEDLRNDTAMSCKVCFVKPMTMMLMPCKHILMCDECAHNVQKCPVCRTHISERMIVYL